jgi:ankyrin repeat protein
MARPAEMDTFGRVLLVAAANGYASEIAPAASVSKIFLNDDQLWDLLATLPRGNKKRTPIMAAAYHGKADRLKWLLQRRDSKAKIDLVEAEDGRSALHLAAFGNHARAIGVLIESRAAIEIKDKKGKTALYLACEEGKNSAVEYLAVCGANPSAIAMDRSRPIHAAAKNGHEGTVCRLIEEDVDPDEGVGEFGKTALYIACQSGFLRMARYLLQQGADPNFKVESEERMDSFDGNCFSTAVARHHEDVALALLEYGLNPNGASVSGRTLLHDASSEGTVRVVKRLLELGAKIETNYRCGPLHFAAFRGDDDGPAIIRLLLNAGADIEAEGNVGNYHHATPLGVAAGEGNASNVVTLLRRGAKVDKTWGNRLTPLMAASWMENGRNATPTIMALLAAGAKIDLQGADDQTALHIACHGGFTDVAMLLVKSGADGSMKNRSGRTAVEVARQYGHAALANRLQERIRAMR